MADIENQNPNPSPSPNPYYSEYFEKERARKTTTTGFGGGVHYAPPVEGLTNYNRSSHTYTGYTGHSGRSWWESELDGVDNWDDRTWSGKSVSSTKSVLGNYAAYERKWGDDPTDKLNKVACEVVRLMNSVRNSDINDKSERVLSIGWASKSNFDTNDVRSREIVLSPDWIVGKDGTEDNSKTPEVVDAIGGQALLASTLKRTISRTSWNQAQADSSPNSSHNKELWSAVETALAKNSLINEWPGSTPYLWRHQTLMTSKSDDVKAFIEKNKEQMSGAVAAVAWKIANPKHPIEVPSEMKDHVDAACKLLDGVSANNRYDKSIEATQYLSRYFKPDPASAPDEASGGGSGSGGDDGKSVSITDKSLFGDVVSSNSDKVPKSIKQDDDLDKFDTPDIPPGCAVISRTVWHEAGVSPAEGRGHWPNKESAYAHACKGVMQITKSIIASMRFRMTDNAHPIYGTHSGELDDGSIYKLGTRAVRNEINPAVFERSEIVAVPNVAVCILVDESGSMGAALCASDPIVGNLHDPAYLSKVASLKAAGNTRCYRHYRYQAARSMAIAMTEALSRLKGISLCVYGHTQFEAGNVDLIRYLDSKHKDKTGLVSICSRSDNADGYAMAAAMREMNDQFPEAKQKYLFVVSDGAPHAQGDRYDKYGREPAYQHMNNTVKWGRRKFRISTYGIGIENAYSSEEGEAMYGKGNFVVLPDSISSARVISSFLAKVTTKL